MPRHTTLTLVMGQWNELTDAAVAAITTRNLSGDVVWLQATVAQVAPAAPVPADGVPPGAQPLYGQELLSSDLPLVDLFPGVIATVGRVWAWPTRSGTQVTVSHA